MRFQAIYEACDRATMPELPNCSPGDWWRAVLVFGITTGWRISEILSLRKDDLDLETGRVLTRAADNKGGRDDIDHLIPVALEHVRGVVGFSDEVFPWQHDYRTLWSEFQRIQKAAGVRLQCTQADDHQCNESCRYYGFHSLRRSFATQNVGLMNAATLQKKMRHRSFTTTLSTSGWASR
jgi:integrase